MFSIAVDSYFATVNLFLGLFRAQAYKQNGGFYPTFRYDRLLQKTH